MKGAIALLLLLAAPAGLAAQDTLPHDTAGTLTNRPVIDRTLNIDGAVAIALRESPMVRMAMEDVEAAQGRELSAKAEGKPWVSASAFLSGGNNPAILGGSSITQPQALMAVPGERFTDLNVMLMAPLYTGGRVPAMVRGARASRGAAEFQLTGQRQAVVLMTKIAFNEVLARRSMVSVARTRLRENEERLRLDRARLAAEAIPAYFVQRSEAEAAMSRQEVTNAERDVEIALIDLKTTMGVHPSSRLDVSGSLEEPALSATLAQLTGTAEGDPLPALIAGAQKDRPELRAAVQEVRAAEAEMAAVRGAYRPQLNVTAMGDLMTMKGESSRTGGTVGLVASMPLYNGGQKTGRIRTAEAELDRVHLECEQVALQVAREVTTAWLNARAAEQNVETNRAGLKAAVAEFEAANMRYQVGRSTVVEALDALTTRTRAESSVVEALFQYNVARDQLLRAVGRIQ